jgi:hypothetical protein
MGQGMRVTVDAAMRARDISRIRPQDEAPPAAEEAPPAPQAAPAPTRGRRGEKRRLAKRRAAKA